MTLALVLAGAFAVACVVAVAWPFLREPEPVDDTLDEPSRLRRRRLALAEERDRALAALKELEFDNRTGKVTDDDYPALAAELRLRAAEAIRALGALPGGDDDAAPIERTRSPRGQRSEVSDSFR